MLPSASKHQRREPHLLRGIPGYIYVLTNSGLKHGLVHVGLSRRGGWAKALELNRDKSNAIPGTFECVFEMRAQDSASALEAIFSILEHARHGRHEQGFFEIDVSSVEHVINRCIAETDQGFRARFERDNAQRGQWQKESEKAKPLESERQAINQEASKPIRESIFKKAFSWLT